MGQALSAIERAAISLDKPIELALTVRPLTNNAMQWTAIVDLPPYQTYKTENLYCNDFFILQGEARGKTKQWLSAGTYFRDDADQFEITSGAFGSRLLHYSDTASERLRPCIISAECGEWQMGRASGMHVLHIAHYPHQLILMHWDEGCHIGFHRHPFGEEIFVLSGMLVDDQHFELRPGSWVRLPPGTGHSLQAKKATQILLRNGHLGSL